VDGEHLAQPRAAGGQVAREQRMVLWEAGLAAERLLSAAQPAPAPATIAGAPAAASRSASASTAAGSAAADRSTRSAPKISCGSGAGSSQASIGTITIAGPRPVSASW
jgi:hypothetical protein